MVKKRLSPLPNARRNGKRNNYLIAYTMVKKPATVVAATAAAYAAKYNEYQNGSGVVTVEKNQQEIPSTPLCPIDNKNVEEFCTMLLYGESGRNTSCHGS